MTVELISIKTTLKLIKIDNSLGVIIPKHILEKLELKINDLIERLIRKFYDDPQDSETKRRYLFHFKQILNIE